MIASSGMKIGYSTACSALLVWLVGCQEQIAQQPMRIVTFDTATKQPVVIEAVTQYPAEHPVTGKPTLMPALYCPKCQVWHRAPPPEELARAKQPATCSKCKGWLVVDGPAPH